MMPRIPPDSFFIAVKWPFRWMKSGQVYYINHPQYGRIIKTLDKRDGDALWLRGESAESVSTEAMGAITKDQVVGRLVYVVRAPEKPV